MFCLIITKKKFLDKMLKRQEAGSLKTENVNSKGFVFLAIIAVSFFLVRAFI